MGKKAESLITLASLGFNTPDFEIVMSEDEIADHRKQFEAWGEISIRADYRDPKKQGFNLPFHPQKNWKEEGEFLLRGLLSDKKKIAIVSKGINPLNSLVGGKMECGGDDGDYIEYFIGPGTIRDMETNKMVRHLTYFSPMGRIISKSCPLAIMGYRATIEQLRRECLGCFHLPFVIEWSIYSTKIGKKSRNLIVWEHINMAA